MLDVCLLGCGGIKPTASRNLTALMLKNQKTTVLIDCGENTQVNILKASMTMRDIDVICLTHFHADHIGGLLGLMASISNDNRTEPITIIGPVGVRKVVETQLNVLQNMSFKIAYIELREYFQSIEFYSITIECFMVKHRVPCYGYSVVMKRPGKFIVSKAESNHVSEEFYAPLQRKEVISSSNGELTSDLVLGNDRPGIKVTYCTDSKCMDWIAENAKNADLFVCEGMYAGETGAAKVETVDHMSMEQAAYLANKASVAELWLTHFSPQLDDPFSYLASVKEIFRNTHVGRSSLSKTIRFKEVDNDGE